MKLRFGNGFSISLWDEEIKEQKNSNLKAPEHEETMAKPRSLSPKAIHQRPSGPKAIQTGRHKTLPCPREKKEERPA